MRNESKSFKYGFSSKFFKSETDNSLDFGPNRLVDFFLFKESGNLNNDLRKGNF